MEYIRVESPHMATHWIPEYDSRYSSFGVLERAYRKLFSKECNDDKYVTLGKPYKLFESPFDGELSIIDNNGKDAMLWICHKGYFVKMVG